MFIINVHFDLEYLQGFNIWFLNFLKFLLLVPKLFFFTLFPYNFLPYVNKQQN